MDWLKSLVPALATALGGPLAGAAATFIADKLGVPAETVSEVLASGKMSPDQITQVKLAEIDFKKFLEDNKIKLEAIDANDRASARSREMAVRDKTPAVLAGLITLGFFSVLAFMLRFDVPASGRDALLVMLGALGGGWGSVVAYYFGSSAGSAQKNELLGRLTK